MNEDGVRVSRIDWLTAVPSLRLCDAIRLAVSLRVLIPVFLLLSAAFVAMLVPGLKFNELKGLTDAPGMRSISDFESIKSVICCDAIHELLRLTLTGSFSQFCVSMLTLELWMLIAGFCGVAAVRSAGCRFCTGTGPGVITSAWNSLKNWKAILVSAVLSGILLGLLCAAFRILCWTGARTHMGVAAVASLLCVVGCLVLGFGWLLSLAAIAIDRCDGAEALSRGICYALSRWQRLIVYVTTCWLILVLGDLVMSWLLGNAHVLASAMHQHSETEMAQESRTSLRKSLEFFGDVFRLSIFVCEIAIVYVLLRKVEDGVGMHEIDGGSVAPL